MDDLRAMEMLTQGKRLKQTHWAKGCYIYLDKNTGNLLNHKKSAGYFPSSEAEKNSEWVVEDKCVLVEKKDLASALKGPLFSEEQRDHIINNLDLQ